MKKTILCIVFAVVALAVLINVFRPSKTLYGTKAVVTVPKAVDAATSSIKNVTFIVDNSVSMRGYVDFSGNKEQFKNAKKSLLAKTGEFMGNCDTKLHAKAVAICNGKTYNTSQTIQSLSNYSAFGGQTTEVQKLLEMAIAQAQGDTTLSVVVSDLILSYGINTLSTKGDKYYNQHSLDDLNVSVRNEFKRLEEQDKGVLIAKYEGDFNGKFYCNYTENQDPCGYKDTLMSRRPFYFMVIGSSKAIKNLVNNKCLPEECEKIFSSLKLEDSDMTAQEYTVSQPDNQTQWILGNPNYKKEEKASSETYSMTITKNLKNAVSQFDFTFPAFEIPPYICNQLTPEFDVKQLQSVTSLNNNCSFTVKTVPFQDLEKTNKVKVNFTSPRYVDYKSSSILDDIKSSVTQMEGRTWGFEAIVKALYDAYDIKENDKNIVVSLDFVINKQ